MSFDYFDGEVSEACTGIPELDFPELFPDFCHDEFNSFDLSEECDAYIAAYRRYSPIALYVFTKSGLFREVSFDSIPAEVEEEFNSLLKEFSSGIRKTNK